MDRFRVIGWLMIAAVPVLFFVRRFKTAREAARFNVPRGLKRDHPSKEKCSCPRLLA